MAASLEILGRLTIPGRKYAALGDMLELGDRSPAYHREVGELAARHHVDSLFLRGNNMRLAGQAAIEGGMDPRQVRHCKDNNQLIRRLKQTLKPGDALLVKGSHGTHLEEVMEALLK
jgi:UDP-N-acetylmuramoyl-tripeptide--D-alanyl-D-alanine ligase